MPEPWQPHPVWELQHADLRGGICKGAQGLDDMPPNDGEENAAQAMRTAHDALSNKFTAYGIELESVEEFQVRQASDLLHQLGFFSVLRHNLT